VPDNPAIDSLFPGLIVAGILHAVMTAQAQPQRRPYAYYIDLMRIVRRAGLRVQNSLLYRPVDVPAEHTLAKHFDFNHELKRACTFD